MLARFPGFGPVALRLFPDPLTGRYKDPAWQQRGDTLQTLLTPEEYASAKRTTFNAFYTSPLVIQSMHEALMRCGVSPHATVLEPGCGSGRFIALAPPGMHFIGVELDRLSGRIAQVLHPGHDIRIENFRDTHLPENRIDAVIGNVPFADVKLTYGGTRLSLHDFFFTKSIDALQPDGVLALVTTHYTLDKQNAAFRASLAERADFLGAIRLPSDAFKQEGTRVVTDLLFLRKRAHGEPAHHIDSAWLHTDAIPIDGVETPINRYFLRHPEMVLGTWSRTNRLYGGESSYSVTSHGDLAAQLHAAIQHLPEGQPAREATLPPADTEPVADSFTPPPPLAHLSEGSFFVGEHQAILHALGGEAVPVTHGNTPLQADGTLLGRRLAGLIELRDLARRVLQSQNEGWPEAHRHTARQALSRTYDGFVETYGPINKTTFSPTSTGTMIRRMPNLVTFRADPDAMLVMSLEHYDDVTGTATKAAIQQQDVVGRSPPITEVHSAEEGLLVCLDHRGTVDLPYIATLYNASETQIIAELGDPGSSPGQVLIYQDPESGAWQTADVYLSGNVRTKLAAAERAGPAYVQNAKALRAVQPEDILPGDIDANLGAPWIPEQDIHAFAAELFGVPPSSIHIGHLAKDAVWSVDAERSAWHSVAITTEYGTPRISGVRLLEQALNLKTPTIYDTIDTDGKEERVLNQEATLAARDKQQHIKTQFHDWVFADPERTERLVRRYNDVYNNLRLRRFDGSHLDFPGMNRTMALQPHQQDAVWRAMSSGNTLLAHAVGAGKTFTMMAAGMKMQQAGLLTKPMYVVPNHMLEQFARECMQLYPDARLLIAGKEDLARNRRKLLTAKIASGDWDGIIVTHSSFERIGMSRAYQERFLREQIAEYDQLLCDGFAARADAEPSRAHRNIIKTIEKQKAAREARLHDLLAQEKKDDGLVFDELGVDHLFLDESHFFKNLETPTKMDRVAGIQTGGSERAFDLFMKTRYLHEQHPGHGVTFATGTPISNTMVEMYTVQRFLDPEGLRQRGLEHFDAWAATFGDIIETMEITPDGASLRPRSRFARFTNLPELQQMFRAFADVQTADMLDLPRPRLAGGKATVVACPMSDTQYALQEALVARYERLRSQKVDPREDNALAITTDGRKLALDARLLSATAPDCPDAKINALVDHVTDIWQRTTPVRGTQLIFCDMGVHPTKWGYAVYQEVIDKLAAHGIPREEIAAIGSADTDAKKQALFDKVRTGTVRVLLGSTQKMGTGTNVQQRLVALHHLDAPWKPAEVEQRDGRILRQGNMHEEVTIFRYVTEGSFDAYMWQALETKARFIAQVITGDSAVRHAEDIGGQELSYAEVKAIASGNPAVLTLAEAEADLQRLIVLKKHHTDEQYLARRRLRDLPEDMARLERRIADLTHDLATATAHATDPIVIGEHACDRRGALDLLATRLTSLPDIVHETHHIPLGMVRGLRFALVLHPHGSSEVYVEGVTTRQTPLSRDHPGPRAILNAVERIIETYETRRTTAMQDLALAHDQVRDYTARLGTTFAHETTLTALTGLRDQLKTALSTTAPTPDAEELPPVHELAQRLKALKDAQAIESAPQRPISTRTTMAEEPVTTRLRQRAEARIQVESKPLLSILSTSPPKPVSFLASTALTPPTQVTLCDIPRRRAGTTRRSTTAPPTSYRERVTREKRKPTSQLDLF